MEKKTISVEVLTRFIDILRTEEFSAKFDINSTRMSVILSWVHDLKTDDANFIKEAMRARNKARQKSQSFRSLFKDGPSALRELGTEQTKQVLKAAVALVMFASKDKRILEMYRLLFSTGRLGGSLLIGTRYIPSKCNSYVVAKGSCFHCKVPRRIEVLMYFHALMYCVRAKPSGRKNQTKFRVSNHSANRVGFAVSLLVSAWTSMAKKVKFRTFEDMVSPYIIWNTETCQFLVLTSREEGFAPKTQSVTLASTHEPVHDAERTDESAFRRSSEHDSALRYLTDLFFISLEELVSHNYLYECQEDSSWLFLKKYQCQNGSMPDVFAKLPQHVSSGLGYDHPLAEVYDVDEDSIKEEVIDVDDAKEVYDGGESHFPLRKFDRKRKRDATGTIKTPELALGARILKVEDIIREEDLSNTRRKIAKRSYKVVGTGDGDEDKLFKKLLCEMQPYCRVHDISCLELIETDANESGFELDGKVQLIATDPPYNIRSDRQAPNSSHDKMTNELMAECVLMFDRLLKVGGHGVVFCSALQFHQWHALLKEHKRVRQGVHTDEPSQPRVNTYEAVFNVEDVMLTFVRAPGHYFQNPRQLKLSHVSVVETAIHFWKRGLRFKDEMNGVNYQNHGYIPSRHSARTNCLDNIPRLDGRERIMVHGEKSDFMLRPEQKNIAVMMEIISKYTRPGEIVVDPFGGTFTTGKACMLLDEHRKFVGCDSDEICVAKALSRIVETFAEQVRNPSSDISLPSDVTDVANNYLRSTEKVLRGAMRMASRWNPPPGLPLYQRLPIHVHRYISCQMGTTELALVHTNSPPDLWPSKCRAFLDTVNPNDILAVEAASKGFIVSSSTIRHPSACRGVFTTRSYKKGEELLPYYGTLVYQNLDSRKETTKSYGTGILGVRKERFSATALELHTKASDSNHVSHPIYVVPAPFCLAAFINDCRYLPKDKDANERTTEKARTPNVHLTETSMLPTRDNLRSNRLITVQSIRDIARGEELFLDYGPCFGHWRSVPPS